MSVTSAMSAELMAVSTIWTYDIYKVYKNPEATGQELVSTSHYCIIVFAFLMAGFSTILSYTGISMGYLYLLMGVLVSSAVLPIIMTFMWKRMNWYAAVFSPILGFVASVSSWLGTAKNDFGSLTVASTGANNPMLVGNVVALLSPILFIGILTALKPDNEKFETMRAIQLDDDNAQLAQVGGDENDVDRPTPHRLTREELLEESAQLGQASFFAKILVVCLTIAFLVLWPMPMYGTSYIFSRKFFTGWVVVGIFWIFLSLLGLLYFLTVSDRTGLEFSRFGKGAMLLHR
jgi:urea-proton symporter